eukprot:CAMPEP_0204157744 /NCGR_PEP_ID=MMETSP0361-20130328/31502_1 /ASSEMBLY_ACC=CAM_ASM_000343 /TAXON_ID=268821 /ORGANISM="Scrippsiella Hangoei, Strain SHTV-5" /LENGTH=131 /DNA_ID=CAMNT_0051113569 /DNA_START=127 /DNA_END=522 /DNA_ORIENTATION=+
MYLAPRSSMSRITSSGTGSPSANSFTKGAGPMPYAASPMARSPALAETAQPAVGGASPEPSISAAVLRLAMYQCLPVLETTPRTPSKVRGALEMVGTSFRMFHCSPEDANQKTIGALQRLLPAYTNCGLPS